MKFRSYYWIYSRKYQIISIIFDFILFIILKEEFSGLLKYTNPNIIYFLFFVFVFAGYILDKYNRQNLTFVFTFYKYIKLFIIFVLIYLIFAISTFLNVDYFGFYYFKDVVWNISKLITPFLLSQLILEKYLFRKNKNNILLIGNVKCHEILLDLLKTNKLRYEVKLTTVDQIGYLSNLKKFQFIISNTNNINETLEIRRILESHDINNSFYLLPEWCRCYLERLPSDLIQEPFNYQHQSGFGNCYLQKKLKRLSDIAFSFIILILTSPLILISSLFIYLEDGNPVLYSQYRNGINKKKIKIYKLRTMIKDAEKTGAQWSLQNDKRILFIGSILRKSRIDELPQLISVIKGEMSLIGPRPERPFFDDKFSKQIKFYDLRYLIKPGLSGWSQVNYPYGASDKDASIKLSYDLFYISQFSLWLDFLILFKTIKILLRLENAITPNRNNKTSNL